MGSTNRITIEPSLVMIGVRGQFRHFAAGIVLTLPPRPQDRFGASEFQINSNQAQKKPRAVLARGS
jgi:hypothetical protein